MLQVQAQQPGTGRSGLRTHTDIPRLPMPPLRGRRAGLGDDKAPAGRVILGVVICAAAPRAHCLTPGW